MDTLEFSEDEIKRQLQSLGYFNVSETRMKQFRKDLHKLIEHDRSTSGSSWFNGVSSPGTNSETSDFSNNFSKFQPHIQSKTCDITCKQDEPITSQPYWVKERENNFSLNLPQTDNRRSATPEWTELTSNDPVTSEDTSSDAVNPEITPRSNVPGKVITKRKVLRKEVDGTPRIYDESLMEDPATRSQYRGHDLSLDQGHDFSTRGHERSFDDLDPRLNRVRNYDLPARPHTAKPTYKRNENSFQSKDQLPSYIRSNNCHPHTRNIVKTDPVNKYHDYKESWSTKRAPGEKTHHELRWEIKAQMMIKEEPAPKPQRVYIPNSYVVPTSKKRSALRWEVRHAMANGTNIPSTYNIY